MYNGSNVFAQIMGYFPRRRFNTCVNRYNGNAWNKKFSCLQQFKIMAFAQLTYRRSLRDTVACLKAMQPQLYHSGIKYAVPKSTLANANELRDWRIFAEISQVLIARARLLYAAENFGEDLKDFTLYALDASTIDLCLSVFPWANFRRAKAAIKLHTLMDLRGNIPAFIDITAGNVHDVNVLDLLCFEPAAFYIMDRGYLDFARLYAINRSQAFFVTRTKKNTRLRRRYSHPADKTTGVQYDQTVVLTGPQTTKDYPEPLRLIKYLDAERKKRLYFLTNNFELPSQAIALLYKLRWQVELFFKWIKQHLRIKSFFGISKNAVKTQIWIAVSTYLLVAIMKKELGLEQSLYEILQILSVTPFEKTPILQLFSPLPVKTTNGISHNQLTLWDF